MNTLCSQSCSSARRPGSSTFIMAISGSLAGMAGMVQTLAVDRWVGVGFSSGMGFDAIALALLGKNHPVGVLLALPFYPPSLRRSAGGHAPALLWLVLLAGLLPLSHRIYGHYVLQALPPAVLLAAAGLAALLAARDDPALRELLGLDVRSRVLLLGSEGDTDPEIYRQITGRTADEVRAAR
jgi:hypothetical protein